MQGFSPALHQLPLAPGVRPGPALPTAARLVAACLALVAGAAGAQVTATSQYLARMDSDGDGRVSLAEYQAWMGYAFERMDANGDGVLEPGELPGARGKAVTRGQYRQRIARTFARQDANGDGFLDARELASPPQ